MYVMTAEYGASSQLEKIDMLDYADWVVINKADKKESLDAVREVKKQYRRNHELWEIEDEKLPIFATIASQFNDGGVNILFNAFISKINELQKGEFQQLEDFKRTESLKLSIIPSERSHYLSEIVRQHHEYKKEQIEQSQLATNWYQLQGTIELIKDENIKNELSKLQEKNIQELNPENVDFLKNWEATKSYYQQDDFVYHVRGKEIRQELYEESLSKLKIPKI